MMMLEQEFRALAFLIATERDRNGLSTWNEAGIIAALRRLEADGVTPPGMYAAGWQAARDRAAETPVAMTFPTYRSQRPASTQHDKGPRCAKCSYPRAGHDVVVAKGAYFPHDFEVDPAPFDGGSNDPVGPVADALGNAMPGGELE